LRQRLRRGDWHVFHFVGHGGFDQQTQDGVLVLEDQNGRGRLVSGQDMGVLLNDYDPLRLVVLNACEGARADPTDPFAGTAQTLIQQGIPAVVAMQFEITDLAAIVFAHELYAVVADGYPLDAALAHARKAVYTDVSQVEWATPVLYLRAPDGRVFDIPRVQALQEHPGKSSLKERPRRPGTVHSATPSQDQPKGPTKATGNLTRPYRPSAFPQLRRMGALVSLIGLEVAAVVGLHWLGRLPAFQIDWDQPLSWVTGRPV
jgi:CHAT domain-containing protein